MNKNHKEKSRYLWPQLILTTLYDKKHHKQHEKDKPCDGEDIYNPQIISICKNSHKS